MKSARDEMDIVNAYQAVGTYRGAAALCGTTHKTVKRVLDTYKDRIHFVYRHFPLPNHPNARPAAEAAQCASEQGQFWQYHDRLFASPAFCRRAVAHAR